MYYTSLIILSKSQSNWSSSSRENAEKQFFLRAKALAKNNVAAGQPYGDSAKLTFCDVAARSYGDTLLTIA